MLGDPADISAGFYYFIFDNKGAAHLKYSYLMSGFHLLVRGDKGI